MNKQILIILTSTIIKVNGKTLNIADAHEDIDAWWDRDDDDRLVTDSISGADAAQALFGVASATMRGRAAESAVLAGTVLLGDAVDLSSVHLLTLTIDGGATILIDLRQGAADPAAVVGKQKGAG